MLQSGITTCPHEFQTLLSIGQRAGCPGANTGLAGLVPGFLCPPQGFRLGFSLTSCFMMGAGAQAVSPQPGRSRSLGEATGCHENSANVMTL